MSTSGDGPNPLRPYYIPPSIGLPPEINSVPTSAHHIASKHGSSSTYASSARDMFSDIDYSDYVSDSSQSTLEAIRELVDEAMYKYMSILLAQPFEVAKTILQVRNQADTVHLASGEDLQQQNLNYRDSIYSEYPSDDSDPDEPAYFTSSAPLTSSHPHPKPRRRRASDRSSYGLSSPPPGPPQYLILKRSDSVLEVLSQSWANEGVRGVWKGSNATFIYSILLKTVESWSRSLLAAIINVPDPGTIVGLGLATEVAESPYPWASLGVAVGAAAMAGLILAPLDMIRTRLIVTSTNTSKRGLLHDLRLLPSYFCSPALFIPTILHSIISPGITHATPLLLRSRFAIDPTLTPTSFSLATFVSSTVELFIKLPLETVLRRGQLAVLSSPEYLQDSGHLETIVNVGQYRGTAGTIWLIAREEGGSSGHENSSGTGSVQTAKTKRANDKKGQGIQGLWRGWRVGMWGLVGIWGVAAMGGSGSGGEF